MKLYRNAIILVVVLGLLVGAYFIVKNVTAGDTDIATESTSEEIKVLDLATDKVTEITIENKNGKFVFSKSNDAFTLTTPKLNADQPKVDGITGYVSVLYANKVIEENASDLSKYGLDKPAGTVKIKLSDGTATTLNIGNLTPTKDDYYVCLKDSSKVYTTGSYNVEKYFFTSADLRDKTFLSISGETAKTFTLERSGKVVFAAKNNGEKEKWILTAPLEADVEYTVLGLMIDAVAGLTVKEYVEEKAADLDKYGLKNPAYAIEIGEDAKSTKLLLGKEKVKGSDIYAKLANSDEVFILEVAALPFLDKPLTEVISPFAFIPKIDDVSKIVLEMDGKTINSDIKTDKDNQDNDKFTVDGKDASSFKNENSDNLFRSFYQSLIGITLSEIETGAKPSGKADITITYYLKTEPNTMKVEFISKDAEYYYVVKNGKYASMIVKKDKFDTPTGPRQSYKKLMEAIEAKK